MWRHFPNPQSQSISVDTGLTMAFFDWLASTRRTDLDGGDTSFPIDTNGLVSNSAAWEKGFVFDRRQWRLLRRSVCARWQNM
jgi:hypothetical protein